MPISPQDFLPDLFDAFPDYTRLGLSSLGVSPRSRLGQFAGGVAEDLDPVLRTAAPVARFAASGPQNQLARTMGFLLEEPGVGGVAPGPQVHRTDPSRPDVRGNQHPRQHELDEEEQRFNIEQEAKERQTQLRAGMAEYGPGVFGRRAVGQGAMTSAFGRMHPTVSTGGQVSMMQASGTPAAEAREQEVRQQNIFANRQKQQEQLSAMSPMEQAQLHAASRYRPDPVMRMFQTGMAVAQRYSRDIEAINGMPGLSDAQKAAALENLNGQYEPYFRVLGLSRGVSVPAFGGYGPGQE